MPSTIDAERNGDCEMTNIREPQNVTQEDLESTLPLVTDKKTFSNRSVNILPLSFVHVFRFFRRRWILFGAMILVFILIDVFIFYWNMTGPNIHEIEISFAPFGADAEVNVNGKIQKASWTTSFDVTSAQCSYYYRKDSSSGFQDGGSLSVLFPPNSNVADNFDLTVQAKDTHFDVLRRVYWDLSSGVKAKSFVKMDCSIHLTAALFHTIPVAYNFNFGHELASADLQALAKQTSSANSDGNETEKAFSVSLTEPKFTLNTVDANIIILPKLREMLKLHDDTIDSMIVHLPRISYATALLNHEGSPNSFGGVQYYLKIRTNATVFDLADDKAPIVIPLHIGCMTSDEVHAEMKSNGTDSTGKCFLASPLNVVDFKNELINNHFVNVTAHSLNSHFISQFLGEYHYIRSEHTTASDSDATAGYHSTGTKGANAHRGSMEVLSSMKTEHTKFQDLHEKKRSTQSTHKKIKAVAMDAIMQAASATERASFVVPPRFSHLDTTITNTTYDAINDGLFALQSLPNRQDTHKPGADPRIPSGVDCFIMDGDNMYFSNVCTVIEKGIFKMTMSINGVDGTTGGLEWQMAWDPEGNLAFDSKLYGEMVSVDESEKYSIGGHLFASDFDQTIQLAMGLNSSDNVVMLQEFFLGWDFSAPFNGHYSVSAKTIIDGMSPLVVASELQYNPDHIFSGSLSAQSGENIAGDTMSYSYSGQYYGDWNEW
jgi:hypothetical protein